MWLFISNFFDKRLDWTTNIYFFISWNQSLDLKVNYYMNVMWVHASKHFGVKTGQDFGIQSDLRSGRRHCWWGCTGWSHWTEAGVEAEKQYQRLAKVSSPCWPVLLDQDHWIPSLLWDPTQAFWDQCEPMILGLEATLLLMLNKIGTTCSSCHWQSKCHFC